MGFFIWLAVILVAVILHELAHYALAKWQGVRVKAFSVGMGPIVARKIWKDTEWRISALPLGGYVEIDGMANEERSGQLERPKHGFAALRTRGKIAVLLAGPVSNFVLAILMLSGIYLTEGARTTLEDSSKAQIYQVVGAPAKNAGFRDNDVISKIDGKALPKSEQIDDAARPGYMRLQDSLRTGGTHIYTVERSSGTPPRSSTLEIKVLWTPQAGQKFGVVYGPQRTVTLHKFDNPFAALLEASSFAVKSIPTSVTGFFMAVAKVFSAPLDPNSGVVGPVGSSQVAGKMFDSLGFGGVLWFAIIVNLSLAVMNLLPIPGLDGGRILLAILERLRGRAFLPEQENLVTFVGFSFLTLFMILVLLGDLTRLFR
jgi:regulator of sigma E protease